MTALRRLRALVHRTQPAMPPRQLLAASVGVFLAVTALAGISHLTGQLILVATFGSSCVLVFLLPFSPFAQPINVIGGHVIAVACGLGIRALLPATWWSIALAVALAMAIMTLMRVTHPPAGGNPIALILGDEPWVFLLVSVFVGAVVVACVGSVYRIMSRKKTRGRWFEPLTRGRGERSGVRRGFRVVSTG